MSASRRRFSREYKLEVIRRVQETGCIQAQIAMEAFDLAVAAEYPDKDLNWWISSWYNQKRLHSSLGYMSPNEYGKEKNVA